MSDEPNLYREARLRSRERQLDPEGKLSPEERRCRAVDADRAHYRTIGKRSGEVRRRRAERLALYELLEKQRAVEEAAGVAS
jgi:hypothetical protein